MMTIISENSAYNYFRGDAIASKKLARPHVINKTKITLQIRDINDAGII